MIIIFKAYKLLNKLCNGDTQIIVTIFNTITVIDRARFRGRGRPPTRFN